MGPFVVVYVTVGSLEEGEKLAAALVEERLAACVNRVGPIRSTYRWEGKLERSEEELLIIKTRQNLFGALKARIEKLHSYSVPEIIALPIVEGNESYLRWLEEETGRERKK